MQNFSILLREKLKTAISEKGGKGSGHFGHAGRPGKVGGSSSGEGISLGKIKDDPTNNPKFQSWFEGSKVVDENNNPLVMYHGTTEDFDKFQFNINEMGFGGRTSNSLYGPGFYFTNNPEIASEYTLSSGIRQEFSDGANVKPVYLSIKNPFNMDDVFSEKKAIAIIRKLTKNRRADQFVDIVKTNENKVTGDSIYKSLVEYFGGSEIGKSKTFWAMQRNGYDGIRHTGGGRYYKFDPRRHTVFIAFNPKQIKSVFNEGEFNPNDPNILKEFTTKGGPGSGFRNHAGRPGEVGGSQPKGSGKVIKWNKAKSRVDTNSKNFKKWFGKSVVVDKEGKPMVVYHGTRHDFDTFDMSMAGSSTLAEDAKGGMFFTTNPESATDFAGYYRARENPESENIIDVPIPGANIKPVYLKIENPEVWDFYGGAYDESVVKKAIRDAKRDKKDGVIFMNMRDFSMISHGSKSGHVIVIFKPNQVKSIFNEGTFDPKNPNILKEFTIKGGVGSGNFDHAGRPGKVGGSAPKSNRFIVDKHPKIKEKTMDVIRSIREAGGTPYIVGGFVRDLVMGENPKDLDIEVYGLSIDKLKEVLSKHAEVNAVGVSFGILKVDMRNAGGDELDFSVPRTENKIGIGHGGFETNLNENLSPFEAARRRDFTMNSMFYDPITNEVYDPYGGREDIKNKILRHTSEAFSDDALRVSRMKQFAARFGMDAHPDTIELAKTLLPEYDSLSKERLYTEWKKFAEKGKYPSKGLDVLEKTDWIRKTPALANLMGVKQDSEYHPEGDVWEHTKQVANAAAKIARRDKLSDEDTGILVLASVLHDVGKPSTTSDSSGRITSHGHEKAGVPIAEKFLIDIGYPKEKIDKILPLIGNHLAHLNDVNPKSVTRLSKRLEPSSIEMLARVIEADNSGRGSLPKGLPSAAKKLLRIAKKLSIEKKAPQPILMGRHLMSHLGMKPSSDFGSILRRAYDAQMNREFTDLEGALEWAKRNKDFENETSLKERIRKIVKVRMKGGKGSGNFGHAGRPGLVGGSSDSSHSVSLGVSRGTGTSNKQNIPDSVKSMRFFHATSNGDVGEDILKDGYIEPGKHDKNYSMTPAEGRVYLTSDEETVGVYTMGWVGYGSDHKLSGESKYGYVFEIDPNEFINIQPDEDSIGKIVWEGKNRQLNDLARKHLTPTQLRKVKDGEYSAWARAGKKLVRFMPELTKMQLIEQGSNVAHLGSLRIKRAYRYDKSKNTQATPENFMELLEEIPIESKSVKGGKGSGNFDHAGRPGLVGGSAPDKNPVFTVGSLSLDENKYTDEEIAGILKEYHCIDIVGYNRMTQARKYNLIQAKNPMPDKARQMLDEEKRKRGFPELEKPKTVDDELIREIGNILLEIKNRAGDITRIDGFIIPDTNEDFERFITYNLGEQPENLKNILAECYQMPDGNVYIVSRKPENGKIKTSDGESDFTSVITHEVAHAFHLNGWINDSLWESKWNKSPDFDRFTEYSKHSPEEAFAETFTLKIFAGENSPLRNLSEFTTLDRVLKND